MISSLLSIKSTFPVIITAGYAIIGLIGLLMAYGLWKAKKWGLWLGVIWPVIMILAIFSFNIAALLILMLPNVYYLTRRNTKSYFGM